MYWGTCVRFFLCKGSEQLYPESIGCSQLYAHRMEKHRHLDAFLLTARKYILVKNRQSCSAHSSCLCHPGSLMLLHTPVHRRRGSLKLTKDFVELNSSAAGPRSVSEHECSQVGEEYCNSVQIQFARLLQPFMAAPMLPGLSSPCSKLEGPISRRSPGAALPFSPSIMLDRLAACTRLGG